MPQLLLPQPIREVLDLVEGAGHEAALVGRCVRDLLCSRHTGEFECLTRASATDALALLPHAVVTRASARRITLPTAAGPLDVWTGCTDVEAALAQRDFTLNAIAYRARDDAFVDPHGGRRDLEAGRLRTPGPAKERFAEDPLRALRAARLVAELGLDVDEEMERAMAEQVTSLESMRGRRLREELDALLLARGIAAGLHLLRRTGLERAVAPGTREDAIEVLTKLPADLEIRLAGWLRGTRVRAILRNLRCPRDRAERIERMLQLHPVDAGPAAARESRARRLARRPEAERAALVVLREAELPEGAATRRLDQLKRALERALRAERAAERRAELALDGRAVMEHLGIDPGYQVGRALRFLAEQVDEDPMRNDPATLRALLDAWVDRGEGAG